MNKFVSGVAASVALSLTSSVAFANMAEQESVSAQNDIPTAYRPDVEENLGRILSRGSLNEQALTVTSLSQKLSNGQVKAEFACAISRSLEKRGREVADGILNSGNPNLSLVTRVMDAMHTAESYSYMNGCKGPAAKP